MRIKKAAGKVYGAAMTVAEKKAMNLEIQRQLAEYDKKHATEIDALILWVLEEDDKVWLCTYLLKQYGIDLKKWREEGGEKSFDG